MIKPIDIENYILETFQDVYPLSTWGEKSFFLNPENKFKRGTYFATIKQKDGENDKASNLSQENIYRLNIGISKDMYLSLFDSLPKRPSKGGIILGNYNFQKKDIILPHPIYGWMGWISILNPSQKTFKNCKSLLKNAYLKALKITFKKEQLLIKKI